MEFMLESGKKLVVTTAPFPDSKALYDAVIAALNGKNFTNESDVLQCFNAVAISADVYRAMFKCAARCSYENMKVNEDLFSTPGIDDAAREDFFPIFVKIIEVNCKPFFKGTFSGLRMLAEMKAENQK